MSEAVPGCRDVEADDCTAHARRWIGPEEKNTGRVLRRGRVLRVTEGSLSSEVAPGAPLRWLALRASEDVAARLCGDGRIEQNRGQTVPSAARRTPCLGRLFQGSTGRAFRRGRLTESF